MRIIERLLELQELEMGPKAKTAEGKRLAEAIRKEIPEQIRGHYDRLLAKGKKGVALVKRATAVCTGCQMRVASGLFAALRRDEDISMCDNCARYLLLEPEPAAPPSPPPPDPDGAPSAPVKKGRGGGKGPKAVKGK